MRHTAEDAALKIDIGPDCHDWQPAIDLAKQIGHESEDPSKRVSAAAAAGCLLEGYRIERREATADEKEQFGFVGRAKWLYRVKPEGRREPDLHVVDDDIIQDNAALQQKIRDLELALERVNAKGDVPELLEENKRLRGQVAELEKMNARYQRDGEKLQRAADEAAGKTDTALQQKLEEAKRERDKAISARDEARAAAASKSFELDAANEELAKLRLSNVQGDDDARAKLVEVSTELSQRHRQVELAHGRIDELTSSNRKLSLERDDLKRQLAEAQEALETYDAPADWAIKLLWDIADQTLDGELAIRTKTLEALRAHYAGRS